LINEGGVSATYKLAEKLPEWQFTPSHGILEPGKMQEIIFRFETLSLGEICEDLHWDIQVYIPLRDRVCNLHHVLIYVV